MSSPLDAPATPESPEVTLSPLQRAVRIFTDPVHAWSGLSARAQFLVPLLLVMGVGLASTAILYHRAIVPMQLEQMERQVLDGQMPAESFDRAAGMIDSPMMLGVTLVFVVLGTLLFYVVAAAAVSFGVSFVLGGKLRFRLGLEAATWAGLVTLPGSLIFTVMAWLQETMDVRLSPAVMLPAMSEATKFQAGLISFFQWLNPFSLWFLAVMVIGASVLSGAPRKNVAWVLVGLYLAFAVVLSAVAMMLSPGA